MEYGMQDEHVSPDTHGQPFVGMSQQQHQQQQQQQQQQSRHQTNFRPPPNQSHQQMNFSMNSNMQQAAGFDMNFVNNIISQAMGSINGGLQMNFMGQ